MDTRILILTLVKQICLFVPSYFLVIDLLAVYRAASSNPLLKKTWYSYLTFLIYDFCWMTLVIYKSSYRLVISDTPQPLYLILAKILLIFWPIAQFLHTLTNDLIISAHTGVRKRHYVFGFSATALSMYFAYNVYTQEFVPSNPWIILNNYCDVPLYLLVLLMRSCTLLSGLRRLTTETQMSLIVRQQTKLILGFIISPSLLLQMVSIMQSYQFIFGANFASELIIFIFSLVIYYGFYYASFDLFRLRLFNATPAVKLLRTKELAAPLAEAALQISAIKALSELNMITKSFFAEAFDFQQKDVTLYLRPTNHIRNTEAARAVHMHPKVEELLFINANKNGSLTQVIKEERIILRSEVQYDSIFGLTSDAIQLQEFMEEIQAEVFIPIYGRKALVGYIIVAHNESSQKLVSTHETNSMRTLAHHLSCTIDLLQQMDPTLLEQENLTNKQQKLQLAQQQDQYQETINALLRAQASAAVTLIYARKRTLHCANTQGAQLLGLSTGTKVNGSSYEGPLKQLLDNFIRFGKETTIQLPDPTGNPLLFTVVPDAKARHGAILVSRPATEQYNLPSATMFHEHDDWIYALFLQTTRIGQLIEAYLPASSGILYDFKIKFLRIVLKVKEPIFIQGTDEDIKQVVAVIHQIYGRTTCEQLNLEQPEQGREIALKLFGFPPSAQGEEGHSGYFSLLNLTGTLLINNIEFLGANTQESLALYLRTGLYVSFYSKQKTSSNIALVFGSCENLQILIEKKKISAEFGEQLIPNSLVIPSLATLPKKELIEFVGNIGRQRLGKKCETLLPIASIEEMLNQRTPHSLYELHELMYKRLSVKSQHAHELIASNFFELGFRDADTLVVEARRRGRTILKNKPFLTALVNALKSHFRIAEILGVDRSTVYRACQRFNIGLDTPQIPKETL